MDTLSLTKEARIYNGIKTISLTSGAGNTPVFLPGEFLGQRSLVGYSLWGCKESDKTEVTEHSQEGPCTMDISMIPTGL